MESLERPNKLTLRSLKQQLEDYGIDISGWGKNSANTLEHLQKEIENGETTLVTSEQGELLRKVVTCAANVFYTSPQGKKHHLKEDRQVFNDGRERRRNLGQSLSEKSKPGEDPKTTIIRGIREELGLEGEISLNEIGTDSGIDPSWGYPNLRCQWIRHNFQAMLSDQQFKPDGYIEKDDGGKSTYFIWEEI